MKKFKTTLFVAILGFVTITSCDSKTSQSNSVSQDEKIEIEFIKDGDLTLRNNDSIIKNVEIEVANTESKRQIGLMNRSQMDENKGMLFVFDEDNSTGFWMKDTRIPLDIIFVGSDSTVINVQKNAKPYDRTNYPATAPYRYVLEVNGGSADKWGVEEGKTKLNWELNN